MNTRSLNTIATYIAGRFNQQHNQYFKEEIKFAIKHWRAVLYRREFERHGSDSTIAQTITLELEDVPENDCHAAIVKGCAIRRTKKKVPFPISKNSDAVFDFVGTRDFEEAFEEVYPHTVKFTKFNKFTGKKIKYYYNDNYLYIYGNRYIKFVTVRDVWEDPSEILDLCINSTVCFTDDEPFPIGLHMLNTIIQGILSKELAITIPDSQETRIDNESTN